MLIRVQRYDRPHHDGRFDPEGLWDGVHGISRIAIVGERAWKTVPPIADRRVRVSIEYFATEPAARRWLFERCVPCGHTAAPDLRGMPRRLSR